MMKLYVPLILLSGVFNCMAAPVPYSEALELAKKDKKNIVVVCTGSDWLPSANDIEKAYASLEKDFPQDKVIWALYDEKEKASEAELKAPKPPIGVWNFPAVQILDSEARPVFYAEGIKPSTLMKLGPIVEKYEKLIDKRDGLWNAAKDKSGEEAYVLIAKGLDAMPEKMARYYKPQIEQLAKLDPSDKTGAHMKYTFGFLSFIEKEINGRIKDQKFDEAKKYIQDCLKKPALTTYQRQMLMAGMFRLQKEQGNLPAALDSLKALVKIDPKTEFAQGAKRMVAYYTQPVKMKNLSWSQGDNRPLWIPMLFDVSSVMKEPGTYEIEFKHRDGHTKFRNPVIKSGNNELVKVSDDKESNKFTVTISKLSGRPILQIDSQGTGWFAGCGDVIITKK